MNKEVIIDFKDYEGPVYTGRPRGELLRAYLKLDALDKNDKKVIVKIPEGTYSVTSSFFLGLFGSSVTSLGSEKSFFDKYEFHAKPILRSMFADYVNRALQEKSLF